jgi:hypothetical protein
MIFGIPFQSFFHKYAKLIIPGLITGPFFIWYGVHFYLKYTLNKVTTTIIANPVDRFIQDRHKKFQKFCESSKEKINQNISDELYDAEEYQKLINRNSQTEIEQQWKSRILFDSTPLGNVIMYYDIYKHAFVYSCDTNISYAVVNACAMKYVEVFLCKDFFKDNQYLPEKQLSPFTVMEIEQDKKEKEKEKEKKVKFGINWNDDVFLKGKSMKPNSSEQTIIKQEKEPLFYHNVFRNIGKIYNVAILQKYEIHTKQKAKPMSYKKFKSFLYQEDMNVTKYS